MSDLRFHDCDRAEAWREYDANGIYLCIVCDICVSAKLGGYRPEVLTDPNYESYEDKEES